MVTILGAVLEKTGIKDGQTSKVKPGRKREVYRLKIEKGYPIRIVVKKGNSIGSEPKYVGYNGSTTVTNIEKQDDEKSFLIETITSYYLATRTDNQKN